MDDFYKSFKHLVERYDGATKYTADATGFDSRFVSMSFKFSGAEHNVTMGPEDARAIAANLIKAAEYAEQASAGEAA